jgi:hypothetical protein
MKKAMKIAVEEGRLVVSGRGGGVVCFEDIAEVTAEKVGKITYDEVFLIVREQSGHAITLGELDEGFREAEEALRARLANFPREWWDRAEQTPVGVRTHVWPNPA